MELWIRSQDKELIQKVNIGIMYLKDATNRDCIANRDNETGFSILGAYRTKERALEVLNKISKLVENAMYHTQLNNEVLFYEMPKE